MSRRLRILMVEDDVDLRRMFRQYLALEGYDVLEAGNGLEALRLLDAHIPDAVILDLGLPIISGSVVRDEIAAHAHTQRIPIIVVTGQPGNHEALDVACVLRKPVTPERLIDTVRSCIAAGGAALSSK
jgi:CheY-like chemotaxis protein